MTRDQQVLWEHTVGVQSLQSLEGSRKYQWRFSEWRTGKRAGCKKQEQHREALRTLVTGTPALWDNGPSEEGGLWSVPQEPQ